MAKNQFIRARVAGWEKECIRRKAQAAHMSESEFVRRAAMGRDVVVIEGINKIAYGQICLHLKPRCHRVKAGVPALSVIAKALELF